MTAQELRLIDEKGKQIGILTLSEALKKAQEKNVDLIEIAPDAQPPVAKIIDFKKFKYLEEKKQREAKKHTKHTELKEVRFSPFIGEHDLKTALEKTKKFIKEGHLVKISIIFKGRQMVHTEFGPKLLERILTELSIIAQQEREAKFEGRRFVTIIRPVKTHSKQQETRNKKPALPAGRQET